MINKKEYHRQYYIKNREKGLEYARKWREDNPEYYNNNREKLNKYCKQWQKDNPDKLKEYDKRYRENNKEKIKKYHEQRKIEVLKIISKDNLHCVRCGCDDTRLLEINHKNGGGAKETQGGKFSTKFYNDIRNGKRKTDDLEILCRICNARHYLELKFGELPYEIKFKG